MKPIFLTRGLAEDISQMCTAAGGVQIDPAKIAACLNKYGKELIGVARGSRSDFYARLCDLMGMNEKEYEALVGALQTLRIMDKRLPIKVALTDKKTDLILDGDQGINNKFTLGFDTAGGKLTSTMLVNLLRFGAKVDAAATDISQVRFFDIKTLIPVAPTTGTASQYQQSTIPAEVLAGVLTISVGDYVVIKEMPIELFNNLGESTRRIGEYMIDSPYWIPKDQPTQYTIELPVVPPADTYACLILGGCKVQSKATVQAA